MAAPDPVTIPLRSDHGGVLPTNGLFSTKNWWASFYFPIWFIFIFWAAFISWRPWSLGFYHDDWSLLTVTSTYGIPLIEGGMTRPLNVALGYLGVELFKNDPFLWHSYGVLLVLSTAVCLYGCCYALTKNVLGNKEAAGAGAVVAAISWMLYPWSLGYTAWPVMFPGGVSVSLFLIATWILVENPRNAQRIRWACYCISLSSLIYEAFWFSFAPLACLVFACDQKKDLRNALKVFLVVGAVQLFFVGWYQLIVYWGGGGGKSINYSYFDIVSYIPYRVAAGIGLDSRFVANIIYFISILYVLLIWRAMRRKGVALVLLAASVGSIVSVILYALAGYAMTLSGVFSRTFIGVNIWLSFSVAISVGLYLKFVPEIFKWIGICFLLVFVCFLGFENILETNRWAESWAFQRNFLINVPVAALEEIKTRSAIVFILPDRRGRVESLGSYWDMTAALYVTYPSLRKSVESGMLWMTGSKRGELLTQWDGKNISQYWCNSQKVPLWTYSVNSAYVVDVNNGRLSSLYMPWSDGCPITSPL